MWTSLSRIIIGVGIVGISIYGITLISHLNFSEHSSQSTNISTENISPTQKTQADRAIQRAKAMMTRNANDLSGYTKLAEAYMRKARESGDSSFYVKAETAIQHVLNQEPNHYGAKRVLAWIALGKHDFANALVVTTQLQQERPEDYWVYGLLGDAYTELGEYSNAINAFQQMMDRRPGLPAYTRAAYMRTLHGDLEGAKELMRMAIRGGARRDPEPLAWTLVQYGNLHFHQGQLDEAEGAYQQALEVFPNYYMAHAGMGQIRAGQQQYPEAISHYEQAISTVPAPDMIGHLGDMYALAGQEEQAERQYQLVEFVAQVNDLNALTYSRQLALFYADHQRHLDKALQLAEAEQNRRNDIYTNDALAWVYYHMGRTSEAWKTMEHALRLNTQDASLLYHAGMIAKDMGNTAQAQTYLTQALTLNPYFSPRGVSDAKQALKELTLSVNAHEEGHESHVDTKA